MRSHSTIMLLFAAGCLSCGSESSDATPLTDAAVGTEAAAGSAGAGTEAGVDGAAEDAGPEWPAGAEAACQSLSEVSCTRNKACLGSGLYSSLYGDDAGCIELEMQYCLPHNFAEGSTYTPERLQACADGLVSQTRCAITSLPQECAPPPGTREDGEPCASSAQCKSTFCCNKGLRCGTCCDAPKAGEPCWEYACAVGLACNANGTCQPLIPEGEACTSSEPCARGTACRCAPDAGDCSGSKGVCTKMKDGLEGEDCSMSADCGGFLHCDMTTGKCAGFDASAT